LDLICPILMMHDLDFMKSASECEKAAQNPVSYSSPFSVFQLASTWMVSPLATVLG